MIDGDIVFQRIGAGDVVIVFVLAAPDNASGLILFAGNGLEFHFDKAVPKAGVVLDANGVRRLAGLFEDIRSAGRGFVLFDSPNGFAFAGLSGSPAGRWRAGPEVIVVD